MKIQDLFFWGKNKSMRPAFTLIELLVVIAIIGLLSAISIISINAARSRGRDARRLADMKSLMTGLEMYYNDNNEYPDCIYGCDRTMSWNNSDNDGDGVTDYGWEDCLGVKMKPYMPVLPEDPGRGTHYCYAQGYRPGGNQIAIYFNLENATPNMTSAKFIGVNSNSYYFYTLIVQPYAVCSGWECFYQ